MKKITKHALKVLLAAALASMTVTGALALEIVQVETAEEIRDNSAQAVYYAQDENVVLGTSESAVLSFDNEITRVSRGNTEAEITYSDDKKSVTVQGIGYAGVVTVTDGVQTKTVSFYSGTKFKPGLNILTGTTDPIHYSELGDKASTIISLSGSDGSFETYTADGDTRLALKVEGANYPNAPLVQKNELDNRPLEIKLQYAGVRANLYLPLPSGGWSAYTYFDESTGKKTISKWTDSSYSGFCKTCGGKATHSHRNISIATNNTYDGALYVDAVSVIPYYKVTYKNVDGTDLYVDYILRDTEGNFVSDYTIDSSLKPEVSDAQGFVKFLGWSTEENSDDVIPTNELSLGNEDITLYPVTKTLVEFDAVDAASTESETFSLYDLSAYGYDLTTVSVDAGLTEANVSVSGDELTVTPNGYAGVIKVSVKDTNGDVSTASIRLYGGTKSRPGLNIYTGTENPMSISEIKSLISSDNKLLLKNMTLEYKTAITEKAGRLAIPGDGTVIINNSDFESTRQISFSFGYVGYSAGGLWVSVPREGWNKFYNVFDGAKNISAWTTAEYKNNCQHCSGNGSGNHTRFYVGSGTNAGNLYIDALNIMPYYKVTYVAADKTEKDVYVLYDDNGNILKSYTPDPELLGGADRYSLEENGTYYSADTPIELKNSDIRIYAGLAPINTKETSIRTGLSEGIRFKSYISAGSRAKAVEYGTIVARRDQMIKLGLSDDDLKFDTSNLPEVNGKATYVGKTSGGLTFVGAVNYLKAEGSEEPEVDIVFYPDIENGGVFYTGVVTGLNGGYTDAATGKKYANRYNSELVARPYVKIDGVYYYGECSSSTMYDVAKEAWDAGNTSDDVKNIIDNTGKEA